MAAIILPHEKRFVCVVVRETPKSKRYSVDTFAYPDESYNIFKMRVDEAIKSHPEIALKFDISSLPSTTVYFKTSVRATTAHMKVFNENSWVLIIFIFKQS